MELIPLDKPSNKLKYIFNLAFIMAKNNKGAGGQTRTKSKMSAVIFKKKHIVIATTNSYKTHPQVLKFSKYPYLHAEMAAIFGSSNISGYNMLVMRVTKDGQIVMAKPCPCCMNLIEYAGIKKVYYTIGGKYVRAY